MNTLMVNAAFQSYALCAAILVIKMFVSATYTATRRQKFGSYINAEDARVFSRGTVEAAPLEGPEVAHALRIQRNDLENIPAFLAIGLLYVLTGATAFGAAVYCWTFTIARIVHTVCYTYNLQPWRALSFGVGALAVLGMCVQIIIAVV